MENLFVKRSHSLAFSPAEAALARSPARSCLGSAVINFCEERTLFCLSVCAGIPVASAIRQRKRERERAKARVHLAKAIFQGVGGGGSKIISCPAWADGWTDAPVGRRPELIEIERIFCTHSASQAKPWQRRADWCCYSRPGRCTLHADPPFPASARKADFVSRWGTSSGRRWSRRDDRSATILP